MRLIVQLRIDKVEAREGGDKMWTQTDPANAMESFHRLWNTMERTWVSISKAQDRWRIMVDRAAVNAENGAKESGAKARKEALNGKTRRGL